MKYPMGNATAIKPQVKTVRRGAGAGRLVSLLRLFGSLTWKKALLRKFTTPGNANSSEFCKNISATKDLSFIRTDGPLNPNEEG